MGVDIIPWTKFHATSSASHSMFLNPIGLDIPPDCEKDRSAAAELAHFSCSVKWFAHWY